MKKKLNTKSRMSVKMLVALLTALALMAGATQAATAKKKAGASTVATAGGEKAKPNQAEKTTKKKTSTDSSKTDSAKAEKEDAAAEKKVAELTAAQKKKLLSLLNEGDAKALAEITGVGKVRGEALAKARPFESLLDIRKVKGVGAKVFADVVDHGKALTDSPAKAPAKKAADKKVPGTKAKRSA